MQNDDGRADWPSLLIILGAGVSLLAASMLTERICQWAGVALLTLATAPWRTYPGNVLGAVAGLYCAWLLVDAGLVTPVYSAESLYQPLMLLGGFAALAACAQTTALRLFRLGTGLTLGLVSLGLLQYFFGIWHLEHNPTRAAATFMTPNTLATAINFVLVPLIAIHLVRGKPRLLAPILWLFAGLVATESRGGMLAMLAGLGFIAVSLKPGSMLRLQMPAFRLVAGMAAVWIMVVGLAHLTASFRGDTEGGPSLATWFGRETWDRMDLYSATVGLILERPLAGSGANMFFPLFETVKPDSLRDAQFFYVHNDYLQTWLEFGMPGLGLLITLVATALILSRRAYSRDPGNVLPLACGAGLATCFAHAMVDFPLYVPFILMLTGAYLGALARESGGVALPGPVLRPLAGAARAVTAPIRWALAVFALTWLAQPVLAEMAVHRSIDVLQRGDTRAGLYWLSVARRLEPRHPAHYWAEGMTWREQAILTKNKEFGARADALFAAGARANPYDAAVLLARGELQRRHADLLQNPASAAEVLSWEERAAALRPQSVLVQSELARTLAYAGKPDDGLALIDRLAAGHSGSGLLRRVGKELRSGVRE